METNQKMKKTNGIRNSALILELHKIVNELNKNNSKIKQIKLKLTPEINKEIVSLLKQKIEEEYKKPLQ